MFLRATQPGASGHTYHAAVLMHEMQGILTCVISFAHLGFFAD